MVAEGSHLLATSRRWVEHFTAVPFLRHGTIPVLMHDKPDKGLFCLVEGASNGLPLFTSYPAAERLTQEPC
jgi:hypothetical protein